MHIFGGTADLTPPNTFFLETPPNPSYQKTATFTFSGTDDQMPAQFMEDESQWVWAAIWNEGVKCAQ